jgi:cell division protease FtsH
VLDNLVLQLMEHETLSRTQVLEIFSPIRQRPSRGSYTGYGKRLPSDRPPVLTPKEMALTAAPDGSEQPGSGNGQALGVGGPEGSTPALGPPGPGGYGSPQGYGPPQGQGYGSPQGPDDGTPGGSPAGGSAGGPAGGTEPFSSSP